ncbi:MAG: tyrosine-type recombinase/integrase [Fibrella sp.]|nr:tyrosine-type recombinase/integrase [Armatimonadota bacterium]
MEKSSLLLSKTRTRVTARKQSVTPPASRDSVPFHRLESLIESFLIRGDIERHSQATLTNHRYRVGRVLWLAKKQGWKQVGHLELQKFFLYLNRAHLDESGRWDNPREIEPLKSGSVKSFHLSIRAFLRWLVKDGELDTCTLDRIDAPIDRPDHVQPFTEAQVTAMLSSAKKTLNPLRDEAILTVFLDTGIRLSELCALTVGDVDCIAGVILVREGKGGKSRTCNFGRNCKRALWQYIQAERRKADPSEPPFLSDRGIDARANALTRCGVALLISRVGKRAKIPPTVRVSPHTFRHTLACLMLKNGSNIFALKAALGHESMAMVNRYLSISQADLAAAHRLSSPADRLKESKGGGNGGDFSLQTWQQGRFRPPLPLSMAVLQTSPLNPSLPIGHGQL